MSGFLGYIKVPRAALNVLPTREWHIIVDLYQRAADCGYRPFKVSERSLSTRWGVGNTRIWTILEDLQDAGLLHVRKGDRQRRTILTVANPGAPRLQSSPKARPMTPPPSLSPSSTHGQGTASCGTIEKERSGEPRTARHMGDRARHPARHEGERLTGATPIATAPRAALDIQNKDSVSLSPLSPPRLSNRVRELLHRAGLTTVQQLSAMTRRELLKVPGIGQKAAAEVVGLLGGYGRTLAPEPPKKKPATDARWAEATDIWSSEWAKAHAAHPAVFVELTYRWDFDPADRRPDDRRRRKWVRQARSMDELRLAIVAYLEAEVCGDGVFPTEAPPSTKKFTRGLNDWLVLGKTPPKGPGGANDTRVAKAGHHAGMTDEDLTKGLEALELLKSKTLGGRCAAK